MLLVVLVAFAASSAFAAPYVALRGNVGNMSTDVNQWQFAPSATQPGVGEFSVIADRTDNDTAAGFQLAVGSTLTENLRAEVEYAYYGSTKVGGNFDYHINSYTIPTQYQLKTNIQTLGINVYYDFHNQTKFTPYLGTGIGLSAIYEQGKVKNDITTMTANDYYYSLNWNLTAGVSYQLKERLLLDFGVRYALLGKKEESVYEGSTNYNSSVYREFQSIQAILGLRYSF